MAALYSYVVDHDLGFAPNPFSGYCTLVHCKFGGISGRRNIVEQAEVGDWIAGTGGSSKDSAGHGKLIYLMRVDEKLPFESFLSDSRFRGRRDCKDFGRGNISALISKLYFYFGKNALSLSDLPNALMTGLVKRGPGFRCDYPADTIKRLANWFERNYEVGMHGDPCGGGGFQTKLRGRGNAQKKTTGNDRRGRSKATSNGPGRRRHCMGESARNGSE